MKNKLAILGAGNMGLAIADGIISSGMLMPKEILLVRRNIEKLSAYVERGFEASSDLVRAAAESESLIIAVKPQMMDDILDIIAPYCKDKLVISIAAGVRIATIENKLPGARVVRAMPNTPLTVGEGVTELCRSENVSDEEFKFAESLFSGAGYTFVCKEDEINALTALTSSAVAYFAAIEAAMSDWALENGLSDYDCRVLCDLVSKTAIGSAKLLYDKQLSPEALIKAVASPKGTTEQALNVFKEKDLEGLFKDAMSACLKRAEELSKAE